MLKPVILGTLADWPLALRIAKLIALPRQAYRVPCYLAPGNEAFQDAVSEVFFRREETVAPALEPVSDALLGLLAACSEDRGGGASASCGYHGSATLDQLRTDLSRSFDVRTPAEHLAARRPKPAQALKAIARALQDHSIPQRKALAEYLEGGPFRKSLLGIDAYKLSHAITTAAETFGAIDRRLLFLWARCADTNTTLPKPDERPELGFDRFGAYVDELIAVGMEPELALDYVLIDSAGHARWWASTGVWVWERLAQEPTAFVQRVLAKDWGELRLADLLISVLWLPSGLLDAGAAELMRTVCASSSLVPNATFTKILEDSDAAEALGEVGRSKVTSKPARKVVRVGVRVVPRLVPFVDEPATEAQLAQLGAAVETPTKVPTKQVPTKAPKPKQATKAEPATPKTAAKKKATPRKK